MARNGHPDCTLECPLLSEEGISKPAGSRRRVFQCNTSGCIRKIDGLSGLAGKPIEVPRVKLVSGGIGNVNPPAQSFQRASFVDSNRGAYSNRDDALAVPRRVNGVCHRSLTRHEYTWIRSLVEAA